ncbi:succinate dehydrogenase assembly factor 2 [bacterium]|nr:succinate dehydrogenase assembly factor 2 [bacterium]
MHDAPTAAQIRLKRLKFRATRRGFKEMDLLMGGFAQTELDALSPSMVDAFEALLDQPDQEVYARIIDAGEPPPGPEGELIQRLRRFPVADWLLNKSTDAG